MLTMPSDKMLPIVSMTKHELYMKPSSKLSANRLCLLLFVLVSAGFEPQAVGQCFQNTLNSATYATFPVASSPFQVVVGDFNTDGRPDVATANPTTSNVSVLLQNSSGGFSAPTNFTVGSYPYSMIATDVNGDGKPDLATTNALSNNVSVLLGNGSGGFSAPTNFTVGDYPVAVASADFNSDTKPDFITLNNTSNNLSVLFNTGTGSFGPAASLTVVAGSSYLSDVTTADFNGDGKADLAVTIQNSRNVVSILLGNGGGGFSAPTNFTVALAPQSVVSGDFNNDGKLDIATANYSTISVLLGNGLGSFSPPTNFTTADVSNYPVITADVNADGNLDLLVGNRISNKISVMLGTGTGGFGAGIAFSAGGSPNSIATADFNADSKLDIAVANGLSGSVGVLIGTGSGSFGSSTDFAVGTFPTTVVTADFNGDTKPDLATTNYTSSNLSVLLNNGSGGFGPPANLVAGDGTSLAVADFNRDGKPDIVTTNSSSNNASVLLNNGSGGFGSRTDFTVGGRPLSVATGDVNADGNPDMAVANSNLSITGNNISLYLGNGLGSFSALIAIPVNSTSSVSTIAMGDLNGDGKADIVAANQSTSTNNGVILLSTGSGIFAPPTIFSTRGLSSKITLADVNGNSKLDIISANQSSNTISVLLGAGNGTFGAATTIAAGRNPSSVYVSDLNADGKPDLAVGTGYVFGNSVSVLLGNGLGSFSVSATVAVGGQPQSAVANDFNGDDKIDLATANGQANTVSVLFNCTVPVSTLIYTVKAGAWTDPTVWSLGRLPLTSETAVVRHLIQIPAGTATAPVSARKLTFEAGGQLQYQTGGRLLLGAN
jgi:hypothetical protein